MLNRLSEIPEIVEQIVFTPEVIDQHVRRLAGDLQGVCHEKTLFVILARGAEPFGRDVMSAMDHPPESICIRAASYHGGAQSSGAVMIEGDCEKITGRDVVVIDDIYDSGTTLKAVTDHLAGFAPAKLSCCVLLKKRVPRVHEIDVAFYGLEVDDLFLIGYGMDYQGQYRDLPYIAAISV